MERKTHIGTHERSNSSVHCISKRPQIQLMHRPVVTVGRNSRPVELLLIENVVLRAGLHTTFLHADNRLKHGDSRQIRIRREAFPVSSGLGDLFERLAQLL